MNKPGIELGRLHIADILQRTVVIIGGKGSGKTKTLKMLGYTAAEAGIPVFIFDPMSRIELRGFKILRVTKAFAAEGNEKNIEKFAKMMTTIADKKIIFHFNNLLSDEIVRFTDILFTHWHLKNSLFIFDEMQELTPERGMGLEYSVEVERAVRGWRNDNDGFIFATQRPAFTSKKTLGLADMLILYRITYSNDVKAVREILDNIAGEKVMLSVMSKIQTRGFLEGVVLDFL